MTKTYKCYIDWASEYTPRCPEEEPFYIDVAVDAWDAASASKQAEIDKLKERLERAEGLLDKIRAIVL